MADGLASFFLTTSALATTFLLSPQIAGQDSAARDRYGEGVALFAGEGCPIENVVYVDIPEARLVEGIHRLALIDPSGSNSASDVYLDATALAAQDDQAALMGASREYPVIAHVSGWRKECGAGNVILLVDRLRRLQ